MRTTTPQSAGRLTAPLTRGAYMPHAVEAGKRYVPEVVGSTPTGGTRRKVPRSESKRATKAASLHWQPGKTGKCAAAKTLLALRKDGVRMGSTQRCFANGPSNAVPGGRRGSQNLSGRGQFPPTAKHVRSFPGVVQLSRRCRGHLPPWCSGSTSAFQAERAGSSPVGGSRILAPLPSLAAV